MLLRNSNSSGIAKLICKLSILLAAVSSAMAMPSYEDVLLVINSQSPESVEIGTYFQKARRIPDSNVVYVSVPDLQRENDGICMSAGNKKSILDALKKKLAEPMPGKDGNSSLFADKINYIITTRGVPPYSENELPGSGYQLTDQYIMFNLSSHDYFSDNRYFYYNNATSEKTFSHNKFGYYIVARLDGPGVVHIKNMIDNTGYPSYESYKKNNGKVKLLTISPYYNQTISDELAKRPNIEIASPCPAPPETGAVSHSFSDVAKDVMFAFLNNVNFMEYPNFPAGNNYYADSEFAGFYPFIYRGATFLPGSFVTCYRSVTAKYNNRPFGGLSKMDINTKAVTDYLKYDGSDMRFRHMTCVAYDPVNNWIWCGTGENPLNVLHAFDQRATDEVHRETMRNYGGGIAVFDAANGQIVKYFNADDSGSPLKNNRVVKLTYDKDSQRMWIAGYKGIQYYDLQNKNPDTAWHDVAGLMNDFAAAPDICLDPFDSDKVYFSFYYSREWFFEKVSSLIPDARTSIYEYSKSQNTVTPYNIDDTTGIYPLMAKTSPSHIWVVRGYTLVKYNLNTRRVLQTLDLNKLIPEVQNPSDNVQTANISSPRSIISIPGGIHGVLVTVPCNVTYLNDLQPEKPGSKFQRKNYILRITEKLVDECDVELINLDEMNMTGSQIVPQYEVRSMLADPSDGATLYMATGSYQGRGYIFQSTDGAGRTWSKISDSSFDDKPNLNGITTDGKGMLYAVRGYNLPQNIVADFMVSGACGFGGGVSQDNMVYSAGGTDNDIPGATWNSGPYHSPVKSWSNGVSQTEPMMFMLLDGFYMGEARFSVFSQYPRSGSGGHVGHMLVFEPKSAPFAPRVDEENLTLEIAGNVIEIPLRSPGLPLNMDLFMPESINSSTVQVFDGAGKKFIPAEIKYDASANRIVIAGCFTDTVYAVKLICGVNGIKNAKGAGLINTRSDEFKDEIIFYFVKAGNTTQSRPTVPEEKSGPASVPAFPYQEPDIIRKVFLNGIPPVIPQAIK
ncbi:MAG: hypothetical protein ACYC4Q_07510 [Victivallaceae bacterium]